MNRHIKWLAGGGAGLGAAFAVGAAAVLACTNIATINPGQTAAAPGTDVNITGSSFSTIQSGSSQVTVHWNAIDGPVLAQVAPDASGAISATIKIPANAAAGSYVIVATQADKTGAPAFGTPARVAFQVTGPGETGISAQPVSQPAAQAPITNVSAVSSATVALLAGIGVIGLLLFVIGAALFVGTYRSAPAPSRVRRS